MNRLKKLMIPILALVAMSSLSGCGSVPLNYTTVAPGHVGVLVNRYGSEKGVDTAEVYGVGRYWLTFNQDLYEYPTFTQTKNWTSSKTEDSPENEAFHFQSAEGIKMLVDVGASYDLNVQRLPFLFQRYRNGVDEINSRVLRNAIRDALGHYGGQDSMAMLIGSGKAKLLDSVQAHVLKMVDSLGIVHLRVSFLSGVEPEDQNIRNAIAAKVVASQKQQEAENNVRIAKAKADSAIATARGEAEANELKQKTITPQLIQWTMAQKWNGELPTVMGSNGGQILDLRGIVGGK